ncbi:nitrate- and nitrite sensing domain-containing protein, partial [Streptomyces sp. NPDC059627]
MRVRRTTERLRPRSVRAKIVALLMLPVVSLMALWAYAAVTTVAAIGDTERAKDVNAQLLAPVADFVTALQGERTAAVRYAAAPGSRSLAALTTARTATDRAKTKLTDGVNASTSDAALLNSALPARIDALSTAADALGTLRTETADKGEAQTAYTRYTAVVERAFAVTGALTGEKGTDSASQARVVLELARAREAFAREQALLAAGEAAGQLTQRQYAAYLGAVATHRELLEPAVADLKAEHKAAYDEVLDSAGYRKLAAVEDRVEAAGPGAGAVSATTLSGWDGSAATVIEGLTAAEESAGTGATAKAATFGWSALGASGVAVVLGLIGVLLSLLVSVGVGRGQIVELLDLGSSALGVAGRGLPEAMRKLQAGRGGG